MDGDAIASLAREALYLAILLSVPALVAAAAAGLLVGLLGATMRIADPALSAAVRLAAVAVTLAVVAAAIGERVLSFGRALFRLAFPGG